MQQLLNKHGIRQSTEQFEEWLQRKKSLRKLQEARQQAGPYKIPVVFHIIHNDEPVGTGANVSDARIFSQLEVLNDDFNRTNADAVNTPLEFQPVAGSMDIEFVLAKQSPDGQATTGIIRVDGGKASWAPFDEDMHALSYWPSEDYLNIWVTNIGSNFLGYAQFPVSDLPGLEEGLDGIAATDGVVIDYTVFGMGSSDPDYNLGRTTTHEVGHFFGLRHIWGDESGCGGTDYINDTPSQLDETLECPSLPQFECSNNKMYQNYMDYTDDACMNLFTEEQIERMTFILEDTDVPRRNSLLTSHGLEESVPGTIDLELVSMVRPGPITCDETPSLHFEVINHGNTAVTDLRIRITINDESTEYITVTGLNIVGAAEISLPSPQLEIGDNSILAYVTQINGATDPVPGNNQLSETVEIIYPECEPFAIYWNDAGGVDVTFNLNEEQPVECVVVDMIGREISKSYMPSVLNQTFSMPAGDLSTGPYIIRIQVGGKFYTSKVYLSP